MRFVENLICPSPIFYRRKSGQVFPDFLKKKKAPFMMNGAFEKPKLTFGTFRTSFRGYVFRRSLAANSETVDLPAKDSPWFLFLRRRRSQSQTTNSNTSAENAAKIKAVIFKRELDGRT
jgi:hypothetical protein